MANSNEIKSDYIFFTENSIDEDTRNSVVTNLGANECVQVVYGNSIGISTDTDSIHLEICKITYNKRVYYPGEVHITMTVISTDNQQVKNIGSLQNSAKTIFLQKRISLVGTQNNNNLVYIAKHYYVQSLSFSVGETQTNVVVHAFSPDKKLTFDKYCNAYTSKKLGEDILKEELLGEKGIFKKCDIPFTYNLDNLQRLKINEVELCQPYLIQHNESFHDFVCRVANRCGECFYYEDDTLFLGLPSLTPKGLNDISVIYECPEIDDGGSVISTTDFYSDYTKDEADPAEKSNYYNDEIGADEYFREITDDDQIGYLDIFGLWALFSAMASGLEGEDYTDLISKMVKDAGSNAANAGIVQRAVNDDFKTDYIDKEPDFTKVEDKVIDMLSTVYRKHTKEEEKATRNVTKLDFQAQLSPLMLGDIIKIGEMKHVVTSLQGHYDSTSGTTTYHHQAEAIPFATDEKPIPPVGRVPHILKASPQEAIVAKTDDPLCLGRVRITYLWQQSKVTVKTKGDDGKEVEDTQDLSPAQSPWIRIAVPFAGGLGGMVMTPEKDSHVMVNYIMGNIERPYVDGALYYKGQEPPTGYVELLNKYFQPSTNRRVISSSSGHSITFLDGKGASSFVSGLIPPLGQIWSLTKGCMALEDKKKIRNGEIDEARKTDTDDREFVGGIVLRDSNDIYNISMSTQGRSISISSPFGKVDINAFTGITINAPNGDVKIKGKNISLEAGNNISIVAG
ncbi:MAG: phage baseplate assembly protein V, partial [Bacteroidales bacterium]|nr:phage baseplate assembly protein V [Bacteroidales bacterium]